MFPKAVFGIIAWGKSRLIRLKDDGGSPWADINVLGVSILDIKIEKLLIASFAINASGLT
jgi:hypothetical protein